MFRKTRPSSKSRLASIILLACGRMEQFFNGALVQGDRDAAACPDRDLRGSVSRNRRQWATLRLGRLRFSGCSRRKSFRTGRRRGLPRHSPVLEEDGTAVTWGQNDQGQCNVPSGSTFTQVAAGLSHSMGILENETVIAWGDNTFGQCDVPESMFVSRIDGGHQHSLGLLIWGEGDTDLDGTPDNQDPCPLDPDNDIDGDGYCSDADVFPTIRMNGLIRMATAWVTTPTPVPSIRPKQTTRTTTGYDNGDIFPEDPLEWADLDGDGIGDNEDTAPRGACCVHTYCHQTTANSYAGFGGTWLGVDGVCEDCPAVCEGDTDGDDDVDIEDLLNTIGNWGMCP